MSNMSDSNSLSSQESCNNSGSDNEWQDNDGSSNGSESSQAPSGDEINGDIDGPDDAASDDDVNDNLNWNETYERIDIHPFIQNTGPTHNLRATDSELQFFKLFFDDAMLSKIVEETNRYAEQNGPDSNWTNTTPEEISAYLG